MTASIPEPGHAAAAGHAAPLGRTASPGTASPGATHPGASAPASRALTPLLAAENVSFRYRGAEAETLTGVSLSLDAGESVGLVGESGSGKSTLLRVLLGRERATAGRVLFEGAPANPRDRPRRRLFLSSVQTIFQDPYSSLDPRARVGASIAEPLRALGIARDREELRARVAALLADVGLPPEAAERYPDAFSGGQRQRIAIARALAPEPRLILADEPVSALDMSVRTQVIDLLARLRAERGLGLLLVSHDLTIIAALCDRVAVLERGRIVEHGATARVLASPEHPYTRDLLAAIPRLPAVPPAG